MYILNQSSCIYTCVFSCVFFSTNVHTFVLILSHKKSTLLCVYLPYREFLFNRLFVTTFVCTSYTHFFLYPMYAHCCVLLIHTYVINRLDTHLCLTDIRTFLFTSKYTHLCLTAYTHIYVYFYIIIFLQQRCVCVHFEKKFFKNLLT